MSVMAIFHQLTGQHVTGPSTTILGCGTNLNGIYDSTSWYCVLDETGEVLLEQKLSTTRQAMKEVFGDMPRSRIALETGMALTVGELASTTIQAKSALGMLTLSG
jgi:hypothetical protein